MDEENTQELRLDQLRREEAERARAKTAPDEREAAGHTRRAEKARYLGEKLAERAESEKLAERHESEREQTSEPDS